MSVNVSVSVSVNVSVSVSVNVSVSVKVRYAHMPWRPTSHPDRTRWHIGWTAKTAWRFSPVCVCGVSE